MFGIGTWKRWALLISLVLILPLAGYGSALGSTPAHGSEAASGSAQEGVHEADQGEGHGGGDRSADLLDLLYRFINFALMVIILIWASKKAGVKDFFRARTEEIKRNLDDLERDKGESENKYSEIKKKLEAFEQEKRDILDQYRSEGQAEKERIIAEAQDKVSQIMEQAEMTIHQEIESAKDRLKHEVVDLASQKAHEIVSSKITDKDQDQLVNEFIETVGKSH